MKSIIDDREEVKTFLRVLGGEDAVFDWRIIPKRGTAVLLRGSLDDHFETLKRHNSGGAGVFMVVNQTDGIGQKAVNVIGVRALFADFDNCALDSISSVPLKPHLIVETSPGKFHVYWMVTGLPVECFTPLQKKIAAMCGSDPVVCDLSRIMRVPGFLHTKGTPFRSRVIEINPGESYKREEVMAAISLDSLSVDPDRLSRGSYDITEPLGDGARTEALTHFCGKYIADGLDDKTILVILRTWNRNNLMPLPDDKLKSTLASIRQCDSRNHASENIIEELNQCYAVAPLGGKTTVIREHDLGIDFMSFASFREYFSNRPATDKASVGQYWLRHPKRRTYAGVIFDPTQAAANDSYYNLWRGFSVDAKEGDCSLYLAHIKDNLAMGDQSLYDYILDWMADCIQNIGRLPGVALVLCGSQGTGKGVFASIFGNLFGPHFKHVQSANHLTGQFTKHLADAVVIFADEVVWGGDKQREGVLKTLITESTRLLEAKGKDAVMVGNYARIIMATNESWAVPAGVEERRYCVIAVGSDRLQDSAYFSAIHRQMNGGGSAALLHLLKTRDISQSDIRKFPKTNALLHQKEQTLESVPRWWLDRLKIGVLQPAGDYWPTWISTTELFRAYSECTASERFVRGRVNSPSEFITALKKYTQMRPRRKSQESIAAKGVVMPRSAERPRGYDLPPLVDCRAYFENVLGQVIEWDDFDDEVQGDWG